MSTAPNTGSEKSPEPDPRTVAEVVDRISQSVNYARELRSYIYEVIRIDLDQIRLLSAWEDPVPGASDWAAAAVRALDTAKNVRWTPPPSGSRAGPGDVQALHTFLEAIPTLKSATDELRTASSPLDVRIAARCILADFARGAPEADVFDQIHRATGISRRKLLWQGGGWPGSGHQWHLNWLEATWEAMKSGAWVHAAKLRAYLRDAIQTNKKRLVAEWGTPGRLGKLDLDGLEIDKRAVTRLVRGKSWNRRRRVADPESKPGFKGEGGREYYYESKGGSESRDIREDKHKNDWNWGPTVRLSDKPEPSKWQPPEAPNPEELLIAIEQASQQWEVLEKYRDEEALQLELEFLEAYFNGAETTKEVLDAVGGEANRSKLQAFRRKLARRLKRD